MDGGGLFEEPVPEPALAPVVDQEKQQRICMSRVSNSIKNNSKNSVLLRPSRVYN